jgi:hypothetical protein
MKLLIPQDDFKYLIYIYIYMAGMALNMVLQSIPKDININYIWSDREVIIDRSACTKFCHILIG